MAWAITPSVQADQKTDEAAIRAAVQSYVVAYNAGDAVALGALWSPDAVYSSPVSGEQVVGREAIQKQFAEIFAEPDRAQLSATSNSVQFISPGVAIEQGTAELKRGDESPDESEYSAVYVKREGQWLLDRVTEEEVVLIPSSYEKLKDLEWLIGTWTDQDENATVVTECNWARNNNFIVRSFTVQVRDDISMAGMQIIGWDPEAKQIRSWVFDSDGGFGQGTWKHKDNRWYIEQSGVLSDGRKSASLNIITQMDDKTCTLQSVNRTVDGELLPNIDEVQVTKE